MHNIRSIYSKELRSYFNSPMAYIFLVVFAVVNGYFFTNTFFLINQSNMRALFNITPLVYLFFIPAVSMSLIARERNQGTIEIINTLPIKIHEFVIGKYLASVTLIVSGLAITLVHFFTLMKVGTNIDYGAVICGYVGLALVGAVYASVIVFWLLDKLLIFVPSGLAGLIQFMSVDYHFTNISRGVIDTRNLIYFGSVIGFFLFLTQRLMEVRKWK